MMNKWDGSYDYKGFLIWCPNDDGEWICEPKGWSDEAMDNFKYKSDYHRTIAAAKKWVREYGVNLKEENFK